MVELTKAIFVNVPVKNLEKSKRFFAKLGFGVNPEFTDENAACLVLGKNRYAMLLVEKFFNSFIPGKTISNAKKSTEVLVALAVESRAKVDEMLKNAVRAGGREFRKPEDYGWMYARAFEDLDGHVWEAFWMVERKRPKKPA